MIHLLIEDYNPDDDFEDIDAMVAEFDDGDMFEAEYLAKKLHLTNQSYRQR